MRKSFVALLLLAGVTASLANLVLAAAEEDVAGKLMNAQMSQELRSRAAKLQTATTATDTLYVGYTPQSQIAGDLPPSGPNLKPSAAQNYWSIWTGHTDAKQTASYHRPVQKGAMWDWEPPYTDAHGDSMQGWWPVRQIMNGTGGLTLPDYQRPWWALEIGNNANYTIPQGAGLKRTFGVVGVWHADNGSVSGNGVTWSPLKGTHSAWMGLRRHGDLSFLDGTGIGGTGNPYNHDGLQFNGVNAVAAGGNDSKFPGYGSQMDQMLYRDVSVDTNSTLQLAFRYRTDMSTNHGTTANSRVGWFARDPLAVLTGGSNPNFISNDASNDATAPGDSFMVYVGASAEGSVRLSDGVTHAIFDAQRRWFGEVLRADEALYSEVFGVSGSHAASDAVSGSVSSARLKQLAAGTGKVRLVFRVHTNRGFDDEGTAFSSGGAGAVVLDSVVANGTLIGDFNDPTGGSSLDINNSGSFTASDRWKSTGKPPQPFHHARALSQLIYQDLCGQVGNPARICDMLGVVVSSGEKDRNEASGGQFGTLEQEPFDGMWSPTIRLAGPYSFNNGRGELVNVHGISFDAARTSEDYYIDYELYTGIYDFFNTGNAWRFGWQSYPGNQSDAVPDWGQTRYPGFIFFNPDKQCFRDLEGVKGNGLLRTSAAGNIPDSVRMVLSHRQECYRFGITTGCSPTDGSYWDNVSLTLIDGAAADPLNVDIWQWINDTFPANQTNSLVGDPAKFDTTSAIIKSGLNIAPTTGNANRFDVPGDTTVVIAAGDSVRVDMVFRILPGPGNYVTRGLPSSGLRKVPNNATAITVGDKTNFWSNYQANTGAFGTGGNGTTGISHGGGGAWDPNKWNSARCDTAEVNLFPINKRGIGGGPNDAGLFMSAYHETDIASGAARDGLGIARNKCFLSDSTAAATDVVCTSVPSYITGSAPGDGYNGSPTTIEGTKIIADGELTPGSHVEYVFRRLDLGAATPAFLCPDTTQVSPQNAEGPSTDGHRWQQFSVLPDRWKTGSYTHPVLGSRAGLGSACMLVWQIDDRRNNERIWVSIADSIGATAKEKYGAHNGWHAVGNVDINDPANNRPYMDVSGQQAVTGFPARHGGQPGTSWDLYQTKAGESLNASAASIGARESFNDPSNSQINGKRGMQAPTQAQLAGYYTVLFVLSGDLNSGVIGPFNNRSQNDVLVMQNWLISGDAVTKNRGLYAVGDGFAESLDGTTAATANFLSSFLGIDLLNSNYLGFSGNTSFSADVLPTSETAPNQFSDLGLRNACTFTLDVFSRSAGLLAQTADASYYENIGINGPYPSGIVKHHAGAKPWISLVDGWNINVLRSHNEVHDRGRLVYYAYMLNNVFGAICDIAGAPGPDVTDVPQGGKVYVNFMKLGNNPVTTKGSAIVHFGLAKADRVEIKIYDVTGRLVKTLADRNFDAGPHQLTWDGVNNLGAQSPRGVYFTQMKYRNSKFTDSKKLTVLQ